MSNSEDAGIPTEIGKPIARRTVMKAGAMVGAAAFVIPVVETISMTKAAAAGPSGNNHGGWGGDGGGNDNGGGNQGGGGGDNQGGDGGHGKGH